MSQLIMPGSVHKSDVNSLYCINFSCRVHLTRLIMEILVSDLDKTHCLTCTSQKLKRTLLEVNRRNVTGR